MATTTTSAIEALKLGINREWGASRFYRRSAEATLDPIGKRTFDWLAKQEARHLAKLRQQLRSVSDANQWLEWRRRPSPLDTSLSEASGAIKVGAVERDALNKAMESEKESIAFYRKAEANTPDSNGKAMFAALAKEEEGHLALVEEELEFVTMSHKFDTPHRFPPGSNP